MKKLILSFTAFIYLIFWIIIFFRNYYFQKYYNLSFSMLFWLSMFLIILLMIYVTKKLYYYHNLQYKVNQIKEMNILKEKQNKDIELSIVNEDIKLKKNLDKLKNILNLLNNNEVVTAKNSFDKLYSGLQSKETIYYCDNSYVNAILYNKRSLAEQFGINIIYEISLPKKNDIDILDLPTILFNILDNGIDASKNISNSKIYLKINYNNKYISIYQKNTNLKNEIVKEQGFHGYGLKIVEETVKKYDGICEWNSSDNYFESIIMIKYKKEDFDYEVSNS